MAFATISNNAGSDTMKLNGTPKVPEKELRTVEQCLAKVNWQDQERLAILQYALTYNRKYSRYGAWTDAEVLSVLELVDMHLPVSKRLSHSAHKKVG